MSDENYTPEAIHAAFEDAREKEQYSNYLYNLIGEIPLLNLWDVCYLFARVILYDRDIPDCISDIDRSLLYKNDPYSDDEEKILLSPIQKWLSEQLAKSIC